MTDSAELIQHYFPNLNPTQTKQFQQLRSLYEFWNARINVISRKDLDSFYERHVLHSLGIAKVITFRSGTHIMDVGCGGGFPGIPLAILFPDTTFHLVDSIGKKITVVNEVAKALELKNVTTVHERAENIHQEFDFIISRAVTDMSAFYTWVERKIKKKSSNTLLNGILYLKGGDLTEELAPFKGKYKLFDLSQYYKEEFFETKKVVHMPIR